MDAKFHDLRGLRVWRGASGQLIDLVLAAAAKPGKQPFKIGYWNAHTCNMAWKDPEFRALADSFDVCYPDGMAVVRAMHADGVEDVQRVNAGDFLERFLSGCAARGVRVGLLGGEAGVAESCKASFDGLLPRNPIVFAHHGFMEEDADEEDAAREVQAAELDVLLVGMGSPRQERWIDRHGQTTGARVLWAVGALFEYSAGRSRAPLWMRRVGLEWMFRLALEPRRLAKRYLIGNVEFLVRSRRARR